jgi:hypothetical protein
MWPPIMLNLPVLLLYSFRLRSGPFEGPATIKPSALPEDTCLSANYFSECRDILLDLLCYELQRDKLSPETVSFLVDHLASCPSYRRKATAFQEMLAAECSDFTIDISLLCSS